MRKYIPHSLSAFALGVFLALTSKNAGENSNVDMGEKKAIPPLINSSISNSSLTNIVNNKINIQEKQQKPEKLQEDEAGNLTATKEKIFDYIFDNPPDLSINFQSQQNIKQAMNLSISQWQNIKKDSCSTKPPYSDSSCLLFGFKKENLTNDQNSFGNLGSIATSNNRIEYSYSCDNLPNISQKTSDGNIVECLGGVNINNPDGITVKFRGTMTRDPDVDIKDITIGLCPEEDISQCLGVGVNIEIEF